MDDEFCEAILTIIVVGLLGLAIVMMAANGG